MQTASCPTLRNCKRIAAALFAMFGLLGAGCGRGVDWSASLAPSSTACPANTAEILVGDGFMKRLCGCTEAADTTFVSGSALNCTIPAGTRVFFYFTHFPSTTTWHQIESVGSPSFPSSYLTDPANPLVHVVTFSTVGTYQFRDAFNHAVGGNLIVF